MESKLKKIKDHYIICGWGRMGKIVSERLGDDKIPFVIIENNEEKITQIKETSNYLVIHGDANNEEVLLQSGIKRAKGFAALLPSDADNLYLETPASIYLGLDRAKGNCKKTAGLYSQS